MFFETLPVVNFQSATTTSHGANYKLISIFTDCFFDYLTARKYLIHQRLNDFMYGAKWMLKTTEKSQYL